MKPTVTAIIQARMNSSRLPGKAMLPLAGKPLIRHVFERVCAVKGLDCIVLATCRGEENGPLVHIAESMGIEVFIGSEENVLERFYRAAERFGGDYVMRVTGDNPFTDPFFAGKALAVACETAADVCYLDHLPLGTGVGMIKREALEAAYRHSDQPHQLEHVTPYLKEHPERFRIVTRPSGLPESCAKLRLTVDTPEDYRLASVIAETFRGLMPSLSDIIDFIDTRPDLSAINRGITQRPMTHVGTAW